ncbi:class F sortase [Streptomyces bluensis]|uniref:class F sortase n=1 Tax=Streptomyces bluensis TaxID=33897 RepID=UPI00331B36F8
MTGERSRPRGSGRPVTGVAWAVLLLGLWLWGREVTDVRQGIWAPTTGDVAAVGRPAGAELPPATDPLEDARPQRLDIPSLGVRAPVTARGLDDRGAIDPPPYARSDGVGWYAAGTRPGAEGAALFVGHAGTGARPAVFHGLGAVRIGETVRVVRDDGTAAEFTVDDVRVVGRERFDARQAYGVRQSSGRAELRLVSCGGAFDRDNGTCTPDVIVSAYLTATRP